MLVELGAVAHPLHFGNRLFSHEDVHGGEHPLHELARSKRLARDGVKKCVDEGAIEESKTYNRHIDKILLRHGLGIDFLKQLDSFAARRLDLTRLAKEANREIIVDLIGLVRVATVSEIGNRPFSFGQTELLQSELHEGDTPSDETVVVSVATYDLTLASTHFTFQLRA